MFDFDPGNPEHITELLTSLGWTDIYWDQNRFQADRSYGQVTLIFSGRNREGRRYGMNHTVRDDPVQVAAGQVTLARRISAALTDIQFFLK